MKALRLQVGELLGADDTTLAPAANANEIGLLMADFADDDTLVVGDLTFATFDGYDEISAGVGAQFVGLDPLTQEQIITIKPPVGGWRWEATGATGLPMTIYGCALCTKDKAALLAVYRFPEPITLTETGSEVSLGPLGFRVVLEPLS